MVLFYRMHLMEVRGKSTRKVRKVFVLLSQDMIDGINHMLSTRAYAGVDPKNKYLFSNSCDSPLDGCTAMRTITESCPGLNKAHLIRSRLLRKYLATTSQVWLIQRFCMINQRTYLNSINFILNKRSTDIIFMCWF